MADTIFDGPDQVLIDPEKDYFPELVGEGKRYKDTQAAGRALVEKDAHIAKLEAEAALAREEITKRKTMQELIDQVNTARTKSPDPEPGNQPPRREDSPPITPQPKVEDIVRKALDEQSQADRAKANRNQVTETLQREWGPGYLKVLKDRAAALGLGPEFVNDLAGRSPAAVVQLLQVTGQPAQVTAQPVRANPGTANGSKKNFEHYEKVRLANPGKSLTARQMQEALAAATEQGDDFYR